MTRRVMTVAAGFLVAPLVPALVLAAGSPGLGVKPGDLASLLRVAAFLYLPALLLTGLLGIPVFIALWRWNLIRWWSAAVSGFAGGVLLSLAFTDFRWMKNGWPMHDVPGLLAWGLCAAASGMIIWLSWKAGAARRPDPRGA